METGEHFSGSCGSGTNDWAYDFDGGGIYYHIIGSAKSSIVKSGTCFGKDLTGLFLFNGRILV